MTAFLQRVGDQARFTVKPTSVVSPPGVSQGNYTMGVGLFAPTPPRDHPEHRLDTHEASPDVTFVAARRDRLSRVP